MIPESIAVGFYWGPRRQELDECTAKTVHFLASIAMLSPFLQTWYRIPDERYNRKSVIEPDITLIKECLAAGMIYPDIGDKPFENGGFNLPLWNKSEGGSCVKLRIHSGIWGSRLSNLCLIQIQPSSPAAKELIESVRLMSLCRTIVEVWEPDNGTVSCNAISTEVAPEGAFADAGWILYRKRGSWSGAQLPGTATIVPVGQLGDIIIATGKMTIPPSQEQLSAIREVSEIVGPVKA
jgi:hypothetical protein